MSENKLGKPRPLEKVVLYSGLSFLAYYGYYGKIYTLASLIIFAVTSVKDTW